MVLSDYDKECLANAKEIIDKDYSVHHSIQELSVKVGLGATKLKGGFKVAYGTGVYQYLREQRMQQATVFLMDSSKTLKQISKASGFNHTTNFIIAFAKRFGLPPGQWKQANNK